jgi:sirohydrochlorin ferrochelatase
MERVQATLAETKAVAALLTAIFEEDESTAPPVPPASSDVSVNGLDGRHSAFARAVAERAEWSRDDLEALAAKHNLLPEGALDTINEAALDRCGEPLCEGDDPVTVTVSVAKELLA